MASFSRNKHCCLLVALLLVSFVSRLRAGMSACPLTQGKASLLLKTLKSSKIAINQYTIKTAPADKRCHKEFNSAGTCCDVSSLQKEVYRLHEHNIKKWDEYFKSLNLIRYELLSEFGAIAAKLNYKDLMRKYEMIHVSRASQYKKAKTIAPTNENEVAKIKSFINTFSQEYAHFKAGAEGCFEQMRMARASLFCAVCSGNIVDYLKRESWSGISVKVKREDCKNLITKCIKVWGFNLKVSSFFHYLLIVRAGKKNVDNHFDPDFTPDDDSIRKLKDGIFRCSLDGNGNLTCDTNSSTLDVNDHIDNICEHALLVNKHNGLIEGDDVLMREWVGTREHLITTRQALQNLTQESLIAITPSSTSSRITERLLQSPSTIPPIYLQSESDAKATQYSIYDYTSMKPVNKIDMTLLDEDSSTSTGASNLLTLSVLPGLLAILAGL